MTQRAELIADFTLRLPQVFPAFAMAMAANEKPGWAFEFQGARLAERAKTQIKEFANRLLNKGNHPCGWVYFYAAPLARQGMVQVYCNLIPTSAYVATPRSATIGKDRMIFIVPEMPILGLLHGDARAMLRQMGIENPS